MGRVVETTDSAGGPVLNDYDVLDRVIAQTTRLGTVRYGYDALGRRVQMETPGQPPVTYAYDAASRLTAVAQTGQVVNLAYDPLGRRARLTLSNGVSTEYHYDAASRLVRLAYGTAAGALGDLTYEYDPVGRRVGVGGAFARTQLPDPVGVANYDAANRQLAFGDKTLAYDANGNLTGITDPSGVTSLAWDARDRLASLTGPAVTASFGYDALDRREGTVLNGAATDVLYDGLHPAQELRAGTGVTTILGGRALDEYFARTEASGTQWLLADALGSTVALTDDTGTIQTAYTYAPYGEPAATGAPSENPFQFTGRERDGTGLYYYRARYYHPLLARFIAEDPAPRRDQPNLFTYVDSNPTNLVDPMGLRPLCAYIGLTACAAIGIGVCGGSFVGQCTDDCGRNTIYQVNYVCSCIGLGASAGGEITADRNPPRSGVQEGVIASVGPVGFSTPGPGRWSVGKGPGLFGGYCGCASDVQTLYAPRP